MIDSSDSLHILACQVDVPESLTAQARDSHLARLCDVIHDEIKRSPLDLVVLPELTSIDYSRESFEKLDVLGEDLDGPSTQAWSQFSREHSCHVAYSFPRRDDDGNFRITLAVAAPDGSLSGHYDKIYLAQFGASMEKDYFVPGDDLFVFDIGKFRLAPIICADIRFPELCRTLTVDREVDVILHCGAYYRDPSFYSWHSFAQTRALENQVYFVSTNRAGKNYGESIIVPPWVDETQGPEMLHAQKEHLHRTILSRSSIDEARRLYPFLKDRRQHS